MTKQLVVEHVSAVAQSSGSLSLTASHDDPSGAVASFLVLPKYGAEKCNTSKDQVGSFKTRGLFVGSACQIAGPKRLFVHCASSNWLTF